MATMTPQMLFLVILGAVDALAPADNRAGLLHLLTQRSVQTNVYYLTNFHDEPKAKWLARYREPVVSLEMDRISDRSVQPRYHGLDAYCQEDDEAPIDYLRDMMTAEPVEYKVRYLVGTPEGAPRPDAAGAPEGFAETTSAAMGMWSNPAAQSRRNNPFLERSKKYIGVRRDDRPGEGRAVAHADARAAGARVGLGPAVVTQSERGVGERHRRYVHHTRAGHGRGLFSAAKRQPGLVCARLATRSAAIQALSELSPPEARYLSEARAENTRRRPTFSTNNEGRPAGLPAGPDPRRAQGADLRPADLRGRVGGPQLVAGRRGPVLGRHPGRSRRERRRPGRRRLQNHHHPGHLGKGLERDRRRLRRRRARVVCREALEAQLAQAEDN